MIQGFYTGCVKSGNIGDDILFYIFLNLLNECIKHKYGVESSIVETHLFSGPTYKSWMENSSMGVIGGGSIMHPEELSYTGPIKNYQSNIKSSLLFGTGISDTPKFGIPYKNKKNILSGDYSSLEFPINNIMEFNINVAQQVDFGGLRGPFDVAVCKSYNDNFNKNYIYDPGLLFNKYYICDTKIINNTDNNIVGINMAFVGKNSLSLKGESHVEYLNRLEKIIFDTCNYLISNNYKIYFYSMSAGEMDLHNLMINKFDKNLINNKIFTHSKPLNYDDLFEVSSNFKFAIATRLHANILLNSKQIPTINFMYNLKAANYLKSIDLLELGIPTNENITIKNIIKKIDFINENYDSIVKKLQFHTDNSYKLHFNEMVKVLNKLQLNIKNNAKIYYQIYNQMIGFYKIDYGSK